jgi:hypothetical protein
VSLERWRDLKDSPLSLRERVRVMGSNKRTTKTDIRETIK